MFHPSTTFWTEWLQEYEVCMFNIWQKKFYSENHLTSSSSQKLQKKLIMHWKNIACRKMREIFSSGSATPFDLLFLRILLHAALSMNTNGKPGTN